MSQIYWTDTHTSQIDQESIWARLFDQKYDHIKINNELMPIEHVYVYMFSFAVLFAVCVCVCLSPNGHKYANGLGMT